MFIKLINGIFSLIAFGLFILGVWLSNALFWTVRMDGTTVGGELQKANPTFAGIFFIIFYGIMGGAILVVLASFMIKKQD